MCVCVHVYMYVCVHMCVYVFLTSPQSSVPRLQPIYDVIEQFVGWIEAA